MKEDEITQLENYVRSLEDAIRRHKEWLADAKRRLAIHNTIHREGTRG